MRESLDAQYETFCLCLPLISTKSCCPYSIRCPHLDKHTVRKVNHASPPLVSSAFQPDERMSNLEMHFNFRPPHRNIILERQLNTVPIVLLSATGSQREGGNGVGGGGGKGTQGATAAIGNLPAGRHTHAPSLMSGLIQS